MPQESSDMVSTVFGSFPCQLVEKRCPKLTLEMDPFLQNAFLLFQLNTFQGQGLVRGQVVMPDTNPDHLTVILGTI